ncbi:acyl-CoA dehydrogenase family protein [Alkalicoccus saliphilus]|uniref:Acyl-CoA dehydrogenase n=1 Tax=Alkalicoccus saliphilus TaxID=200989 RepID=A0A2T4U3M1_9BACI|nr:acyl-CoA dehydrogenase family protein [Alkalicoccus saliphilus]PTL37986.1 acyl-CoA dehydrogenase [Alkalicoccus saliphilus]
MEHAYLTEDHDIFRKGLRKFLEQEAYPYYEKWEEQRMIPRSFWEKMGEQGFLCPDIDEKYGGSGVDWGFSVVINEELERVGTSMIGLSLHNDIVIPYITSYGTEEQKQRWLPKSASGEAITALAMTEPGTGSDVANIKTTAILEGDHYRLNGQKTFITNGIHSDLVLVACKTDPQAEPKHKGVSLLIVARDTPGFSRGRKLNKVGCHSQDTAELIFEDCLVPKENLIGEEGKGFKYLMEKLQQERLLVAISAQVSAEKMLEMTKEYVKSRKAFGQPVSKFQNTQFKLVELATDIDMGRVYLDQLIAKHMAGEDIVTQVSMAKWKSTEVLNETAAQCMKLHGGYGYMEEYEIARRFKDAPVAAIYAGTNEIMKTIIAKNMGL